MQTRHSVYLTYLHMLAFALLWLGVILLLNTPQYAGHAPGATAMIPAVGAAALLFGLLLLGTIYRWRRLAFLCGTIISLILLLYVAGGFTTSTTLLELLGMQGLRELRPSLVLTILCGAASICLSWGRKRARQAGRWLGVATVLIALLSFLSSFSQPALLASLTMWASLLDLARFATELEATFNTSLLLVMLGAACLLLNNDSAPVNPKFDRSTLLAGIIGAGVTCLGWHLMHLHNSETLRTRSEQVLVSTQHMLSQERLAQVQLMQRIAQRWELEDRFPSSSMWEHESRSYLRDFPNLGLVGILDDRLEPARTAARAPEDRTWLHRFLLAEEHKGWLGHVLESHEAHMSPSSDSGSNMTLIAAPLYLSERGRWLVVASVDVPAMIRRHINLKHTEFILRVEERGRTIFSSSDLPVDSLILVNSTSTKHHDHGNNAWDVGIYIDREGTLLRAAFLPPLLLLFGLGLTWLLMISQRLTWHSRERNRRLDEVNAGLSASLAEQSRLREQNERVMNYSTDLLCSFDNRGRWIQVNPACRVVLGYSQEELAGQRFDDFLLPEDSPQTRDAVLNATGGSDVTNFRNRYRRRDGSIAHLMWSAVWSDTEQELFCAARDITGLVAAEHREKERQRILGMISEDQPLSRVLESIGLFIETQIPGAYSSIRQIDWHGKRLTPGAAPSLPKPFLAAMEELSSELPGELTRILTENQKIQIVANVAEDPLWTESEPGRQFARSYRQLVLDNELHAYWCFPVVSSARETLGTVSVYRPETGGPDKEQSGFLKTCSQLVAIAVERNRDRMLLSESEQRYRSLFTYNPYSVYSMDLEGNFQSINQSGVNALGYSEQEIVDQHFSALIIRGDHATVEKHFRMAAEGHPQYYQARCQNRTGTIVELDITNLPIIVSDRVIGVFGIAKDITAQNRMIRELSERDQFFRLSLDMFFTLDPAGNFLLVNPAFSEAFGQSPEELLGTPYMGLVFPSDQAKVRTAVERLLQGHQVLNLEIKGLSKSGNVRWLELNATPTEGGIYCAARDITERKRTENQLKITLDELASSNQELENFAFVASHDLQEPLRKIQAFGERLQTRAENLDDQSRDYLQRMNSAAQRMQTLILDLLAYSRVSTRKQPFVDLDLNRILAEVLGDLETAFRDSQAELVSEPLPHIDGDATQIRQVLQNLISNAVKFRQKDVPPRIRVYAEGDSGGTWTLCVADNGIGFDEKYLDRIFDPFQRLHSRQAYPGTGIGLAIVTKIVERHNATITATSTPGTGTIFRITFNRTSTQEEAAS